MGWAESADEIQGNSVEPAYNLKKSLSAPGVRNGMIAYAVHVCVNAGLEKVAKIHAEGT